MQRINLIILLSIFLFIFQSCHVGRFVFWNYADFDDYKKFPSKKIENPSRTNTFTFYESQPDTAQHIAPRKIKIQGEKKDFDAFLQEKETVAFLIIKNDTVYYEKYFDGYSGSTKLASFSVSKSFVSALIGIAIQEGHIQNVQDPVTQYLPQLKENGFDKVTIENLLNMRSGIKFSEGYYNPFSDVAKYYYGKNLKKYLTNLEVKYPPGDTFQYQSANTQLLAWVLEKATGSSPAEYMEEKLWKPSGMQYSATWSTDSRRNQTEKAFCCLNARARDFARFGRLYLNNGIWQGDTVISPSWIKRSTTLTDKSQNFNYYYHWWHCVDRRKVADDYDSSLLVGMKKLVKERNKKGKMQKYVIAPCEDDLARGLMGQYIYLVPSKDLILLRFGKSPGDFPWEAFFHSYASNIGN